MQSRNPLTAASKQVSSNAYVLLKANEKKMTHREVGLHRGPTKELADLVNPTK